MQNVYIFLEILDVISDFLTSNALGAYFKWRRIRSVLCFTDYIYKTKALLAIDLDRIFGKH